MKLAVVFPGIGYHVDKPLLYHSKRVAAAHGYEIKNVPYGNFPAGVKGDKDKMSACFFSALDQCEELLKDVDFSQYEEILFISKSIGTAIASAYARKHELTTRNVYFTPVKESFRFMDQPGLVFHGTADSWVGTELIRMECGKRDLTLFVIEQANHSLETDDWKQDIETLYGIMHRVDLYLSEPAREPEQSRQTAGKVKLDVILEAIEFADNAITYYLDTKTGESVMLSEFDEDEELEDEIEYNEEGRYIPLPTQFDINEYSIMERFIDQLSNARMQNQLARAIQGRGAFRRFKDTLARLGIEDEWYEYRDQTYRELALEWCEENGLEPVE
ncbi:MAG: UPF0158 family protein [Lachnospiraceae bacterium]|nr:UPF0158 family protein [Lachnospiraceae bacterium]